MGKTVKEIIESVEEVDISDIHIKTGMRPIIRKYGELLALPEDAVESETIMSFLSEVLAEDEYSRFVTKHECDFAFTFGITRFRANAYVDYNGPGLALRRLMRSVPKFEDLQIPEILKKLSKRRNGIILVTGPTGSGKTTTLTCVIDYINKTESKHIITIEDPIEYIHHSNRCIITQRDVGKHTETFTGAIVSAMREDPDIIMIGEIRDLQSVSCAVSAAETGHLVFSTLHTTGAEASVDRMIDIFPPEQQSQIRTQISGTMIAVVSQQLLPSASGAGRCLATEVMVATNPIRNLIRSGRTHMINSSIQTAKADGMYLMKDSVTKLYREGKITQQTMEDYM